MNGAPRKLPGVRGGRGKSIVLIPFRLAMLTRNRSFPLNALRGDVRTNLAVIVKFRANPAVGIRNARTVTGDIVLDWKGWLNKAGTNNLESFRKM